MLVVSSFLIGLFPFKCVKMPSHFDKFALSSFSTVTCCKLVIISMNYPMIKEKHITPPSMMQVHVMRSISLFGLKSPKPTVDIVVNI